MVCSDLPVKRCERDRAWLSQPLLLSLKHYLKVFKSGLKLSASFRSSLAPLFEFFNEKKSSVLQLVE